MEGNNDLPGRTANNSLRKEKSKSQFAKRASHDRKEVFTMTETATSVDAGALHPRFGNASAQQKDNSVIEMINYYGNCDDVKLLTAAEKKKIKMSHSKLYEDLGKKFSHISPTNLHQM